MKNKIQLSDGFLKSVKSTLNLNNFRFTKETINTNISISNKQKIKIDKLCLKNKTQRINYNNLNSPNKIMNINWSNDVISKYFNL